MRIEEILQLKDMKEKKQNLKQKMQNTKWKFKKKTNFNKKQ